MPVHLSLEADYSVQRLDGGLPCAGGMRRLLDDRAFPETVEKACHPADTFDTVSGLHPEPVGEDGHLLPFEINLQGEILVCRPNLGVDQMIHGSFKLCLHVGIYF